MMAIAEVMTMATKNYIPEYNTPLFTDVWSSADEFVDELYYGEESFPFDSMGDNDFRTTYYLLYARYGNSPIANMDVNQWKWKVASVIFQYGPTWCVRMSTQLEIRNMDVEELLISGKDIYNHAYNPNTLPSTATTQELDYINEQNTTIRKRNRIDAYRNILSLLNDNLVEEYLDKFKYLFKTFVLPENPVLFITDKDEEEELELE